MNLPIFDELHVISDLHLGGPKGRQIFTSTREASAFLKRLSAQTCGRVGLIVNGDLVDFLAEENAQCFDSEPESAEAKLRSIADRDGFREVFDGFRRFVSKDHHHLAVNLGNHDLELALPWVRRTLVDLLSGGDDSARGRITLVLDGSGYRAQVGQAKVICLHGNEVDAWNVTDYEKLRRVSRDLSLGKPVERWKPNAGSRMVIEVMNSVKRDWPFVDLLKPERESVPLILLALDPTLGWKVKNIASLATVANIASAKREAGFLEGPVDGDADVAATKSGLTLLGEPTGNQLQTPINLFTNAESRLLRKLARSTQTGVQSALLDDIERQFRDGILPIDLIRSDYEAVYLGKMSDLWSATAGWLHKTGANLNVWLANQGRQILRKALECLIEDRVFDLKDSTDDTFQQIDAKVGSEFDFVITGHTHLERALPRNNGSGYYYNTGTWAGIMRLERSVLENDAKFNALYQHLSAGSLELLEKNNLVIRENTVVSIKADACGAAHAKLQHVRLNAGRLVLDLVAGSEAQIG